MEQMKKIIYNVIEYANDTDDFEASVSAGDAGVERYIEKALEKKQNLINLLSQHEKWDANRLAIIMPFYEKREPDYNVAKWRADDISYVLINVAKTTENEEMKVYASFIMNFASWFCGANTNDISEEELTAFNRFYTEKYKSICDALRIRAGQKVNKVVRKAAEKVLSSCPHTEGDTKEFEQLYAKFSDALKEQKMRRDLLISVHPADFLMMSNGVSWSSCHFLDGCHAAGTTSYALDAVSMILFTVNEGEADDFIAGKINRQIYCYNDHQILQSRLYPNYNNTDLSTQFRHVVEEVICKLTGDENMWVLRKSTDNFNVQNNSSLHYPDYEYSSYNTHFCVNKNHIGDRLDTIRIGSDGCCLKCGVSLYNSNSILCDECKEDVFRCPICGEIHETTEYMVSAYYEGEWVYVCEDHIGYSVYKCEHCGDYYYEDYMMTTSDNVSLCEDCFDSEVVTCELCGDTVYGELLNNVYNKNDYLIEVCDSCFNDAVYCEDCGNYVLVDEDGVCPHCGVCLECEEE